MVQVNQDNSITCAGLGCYVMNNFQRVTVRGDYDEFADSYASARRYGAEEMRLISGAGINQLDGTPMLSGLVAAMPQTFRVTVYAQEVLTALGSTAADAALAAGRNISVLKARVTWHQFAQIPRSIELDIGTGFDIAVGPTDQVTVDLLVPLMSSVPAIVPAGHVRATYNTSVQCVIMCSNGSDPNFIGRYTQSIFVQTGTASATRRVALKPEARRVQILSDSTGNPPPTFRVLYDFNPTASPIFGVVDWPASDFDTASVEIPQGASHLEFTSAPANTAGSRITVVQELFR